MAAMEDVSESQVGGRFTHEIEQISRERSKAAFKRVFAFFAPRIKAYLKRQGLDEAAAEDLTQEVMLSVWHRAAQYDPTRANLSTWIFTIARNKRIDLLRRQARPELDPADPTVATVEHVDGESHLVEQQDAAQIRAAIDRLPAEQKRLVQIFYFDDKPHTAIAEELGLPLGTVKSRLRLALEKLRGSLRMPAR